MQPSVSAYLRQGVPAYDNSSSRILLCGKAFVADKTGALYWPAEKTLIVSDLRLGRGSYLTEDDVVLPPFDTAASFDKLEDALDRFNPDRVIALGDSFCRNGQLDAHDTDWLKDLMEDREWHWIIAPDAVDLVPRGIDGTVAQQTVTGGIKFRFEPVRAPVAQEIAGGMHPVASIAEQDYRHCARCFVSNGMRLLLPSMGLYRTGANVLDAAFDPLLGHNGLFVWMVSHGRVQQVASGQLLPA